MDKSNNNSSSSRRNNGTGSSGASEDGTDGHTKKRKVWRTVNVSAGGGPPQAMTPEAAAKYIQQATASRGREVKISFGPSRPPGGSSQTGNTTATAAASVSFGSLDLQALKESAAAAAAGKPLKSSPGKGGAKTKDGLPCSEAEMKALMSMFVEIMGMSMETDKMGKSSNQYGANAKSGAGKKKSGGSSGNANSGPVFMFGGNSGGIPPPPAGFTDIASWEALRRTYMGTNDDDDDDENCLPDLEEIAAAVKSQQLNSNHDPNNLGGAGSTRQHHTEDSKLAGSPGIAPIEWESLEQVEIDDDLESEERSKKAAKKREKKQRKKLKAKEEAAQKAAEAAQKKREKAILSWRSRVVSACQSNEVSKLEALLQESPLRKQQQQHAPSDAAAASTTESAGSSSADVVVSDGALRSLIIPHLEFLLPNSIAKNRASLERGCEARERLANYILSADVPMAFTPLRNGRTALHTACFVGDAQFVRLVLEKVATCVDKDALLPESYLDTTCVDSGWAPLHYAAVSGSDAILEMLLAGGCNASVVTDDTHTWRISDGKGITSQELAQLIQSGDYDNVLESHGIALQEMENAFFSNHAEKRNFLKALDRVSKRLADVEANGYSALSYDRSSSVAESDDGNSQSSIGNQPDSNRQQESGTSRKRKKKKKKNQKQQQIEQKDSEWNKAGAANVESGGPASDNAPKEEDPMVTLLLGMGFTLDQITAAAKACGGTNRATADDLVAWIFGQDAQGTGDAMAAGSDEKEEEELDNSEFEQNATTVVKVTQQKGTEAAADAQGVEETARKSKEEAEEAARRLAAKREEARRRNREWNNREQARQKEEAKAKMAKAMAVPPRTPAQVVPSYPTPSYPTLQSAHPNGMHGGVSNSAHAGLRADMQPGLTSGLPVPPTGHMMQPYRQVVPPVPAAPVPQMAPGALPVMNPNPMPPHMHVAYMGGSQVHPMQQSVYPGPPAQLISEQKMLGPPGAAAYNFHPVGDDDRTVSSYGSTRSRTLSVSSNSVMPSSSVAPSGLRSASTGPSPSSKPAPQEKVVNEDSGDGGYTAEANPLGEIRATAKAFVPANFTPRPAQTLAAKPLRGHTQQQSTSLAADTRSTQGQYDASSSLHHGALPPASSSSLLPKGLPASPYDRVATVVTPMSEDSLPVARSEDPSAVIGLGALHGNDSMAGRSGSGGMVGAPSLLDSLTNGTPMMGGSSIWGGNSGGADGPQPASSLAGIPPFSFGNPATTSDPSVGSSLLSSIGKAEDLPGAAIGENTGGNAGLGDWGFPGGAAGTGAKPTAGQGSIW